MARIKVEVSQDDFERASWLAMRKGPLPNALRFYFRIGFAILWVAMCISPFALHPNGPNLRDGLIFGAIGPALLVLQFFLVKRGFAREYRKSGRWKLPAVVDLDDRGLYWMTSESDGRSSWRTFQNYSEDRSTFVLFHRGSLAFAAIPKRALLPAEVEQVRSVLKAHLPRK